MRIPENLPNLPYSVEEIFGIHVSGKYHDLRRTYNELYQIYSTQDFCEPLHPDTIVVEDSNSGYDFFREACAEHHMNCLSAGGKSNLTRFVPMNGEQVLVVADGASVGSEMNELYQLMKLNPAVKCYLPESFEWLILKSGMIDGKTVQDILAHPEDFIESSEYFSWERFFTELLTRQTKDTYLTYTKSRLNEAYLQGKTKQAILDAMEGVQWDK